MRLFTSVLFLVLLLLSSSGLPAQGNREDDRIYDQVRLKLTSHPEVKGGAIEVKVEAGVVTLQGNVRTDKARNKAESLTGKVKGVKKVINELKVTPT